MKKLALAAVGLMVLVLFLKSGQSASGAGGTVATWSDGIIAMIAGFDFTALTSSPFFYPAIASGIIAAGLLYVWRNVNDKIKYSLLGIIVAYFIFVLFK